MKYLLLLAVFLSLTFNLPAQHFRVGVLTHLSFGSENLSGGIGINLSGQYLITKNFEAKILLGFDPPVISMKPPLGGHSYGVTYYEVSGVYKPFNLNNAPFIEIGLGRYAPYFNQDGNVGIYYGKQYKVLNTEEKWGYTIGLGVEFFQKSRVHFIALAKQTFLKTNYQMDFFNLQGGRHEDLEANLSVFKVGVGLIINI